jgi:hypothetical protein
LVPKDKTAEFEATWREREAVMRQHSGFQGLNILAVADSVTVSSRCGRGWAGGRGGAWLRPGQRRSARRRRLALPAGAEA